MLVRIRLCRYLSHSELLCLFGNIFARPPDFTNLLFFRILSTDKIFGGCPFTFLWTRPFRSRLFCWKIRFPALNIYIESWKKKLFPGKSSVFFRIDSHVFFLFRFLHPARDEGVASRAFPVVTSSTVLFFLFVFSGGWEGGSSKSSVRAGVVIAPALWLI